MRSRRREIFLLVFVALICPAIALAQPNPSVMKLYQTFGRMGLWIVPINEEFSEKFCTTADHGMLVVPTGSMGFFETVPSELRPWDIVVKSGENEIRGMSDFALADDQKEIELIVLRDGKQVSVTLAILEMPEGRIIHSSSEEDEADPSNSLPRDAIKEAVYYQEDEGVWGSHTLLEEGNAVIGGKLIISGKAVDGVEVSLFLAGRKRTQSATTDSDGRFEISLPPGKYFYIGYALYGPGAPDRRMIAVNKNLAHFGGFGEDTSSADCDDCEDCDEVTARFEELASKHGPEVAAEMLAEEFAMELEDPFTDKYPLDLRTLSKDSVPDIVYNEPIKIVAPLHNTKVSLNRLTFAWVPFEGADSYLVSISHIKKEGRSTIYRPLCEKTTRENSLDELALECEVRGFMDDRIGEIVPGELYGLKVYAYDKAGKLLSASSRHSSVEFFVK